MLNAPIPANDPARVQAVREMRCAFAPREERFDRITRTARKLLNVPICMISVVEKDELWFRSVQGLGISFIPRDVSFCGHAIGMEQPLLVRDTLLDERFADNPLVLEAPKIRSYAGVALEIAPGLKAGTLCVVDTMPRDFGAEDLEGLHDLAAMAAAELRLSAAADLQQSIVLNKEVPERRAMLDAATGCWNASGHQALLQRMGQGGAPSEVALLGLRVADLGTLARAHAPSADLMAAEVAQHIRTRLPAQALLTRPSDDVFCVMLPCQPGSAGEAAIHALQKQVSIGIDMPTVERPVQIQLPLRQAIGWVRAQDTRHTAAAHWEVVAAHLQ